MSSNSRNLFDPTYAESVGWEVVEPLVLHYFRLQVVGAENIPDGHSEQPIIFVANHAGRTFPWDGIVLDYAVGRHWIQEYGLDVSNRPRPLVAPDLSTHQRLLPFRLANWWHRMGCIDATATNLARCLKSGQHTLIFPEGIPGIARDFKDRYQLLPFPTPLVRLARQYNARLVPVSIIGSEYYHPYSRQVGWLKRIGQQLGLPFLPLSPFTVFLPFLPWLFYAALPVPTTVLFGQPFNATDLQGADAEALAEDLRRHCQTQLNQARTLYERGMDWPGLLASLLKAKEPFWKLLPSYWPQRFIKHARRHSPQLFPKLPPAWWFLAPLLGWFNPPTETPQSSQPLLVRPGRSTPVGI